MKTQLEPLMLMFLWFCEWQVGQDLSVIICPHWVIFMLK